MLRDLRTSQGELTAFLPDLNPDVTAGERDTARESAAVAGRPGHTAPLDPAGEFLTVLNKAFGRAQ